MSLAESEGRNPYLIVGLLCRLRFEDKHSDEEIATKLRFNSVEEMRQQLRDWELPGWLVGEASHTSSTKTTRKRKPGWGTGERVELPPAKEAMPLFKEALDELREAIEQLEGRKEYFQDGRFVVESHVQGHAYDSGEWVEFKGAFAGGGKQSPPEPLTTLIAVYVLAGLPLEPLLNTLSREPGDVNLDQLDLNIEGKRRRSGHTPGLKSKARHVARLIRAGNLPPGAHSEEFSAEKHDAVWLLYRLEQQGLGDKDVEERLRKYGFGRKDIPELRKLRQPPPAL